MGRRTGQFLLLEMCSGGGEGRDAIPVTAARRDSQLDFDFELAVQATNDKPVYYVQYAHARIREPSSDRAARASRSTAPSSARSRHRRACTHQALSALSRAARRHRRSPRGVHLLTGYALELGGCFPRLYRDHACDR